MKLNSAITESGDKEAGCFLEPYVIVPETTRHEVESPSRGKR